MPKMLIDFSQEDADKLKDYAAQHGHKVKPFVEYLVRMQIGSVPPPQVQPVKMQPAQAAPAQATAKSAPAQAQPERKPEQVKPVESRSQVAPEQAQPSAAPKKRDLSKFNEKVSAQVFTDGQEFMLNRFGKRTFYSTAEEAETARAGSI
jgi:hypothetical protein